MTGILTGDTGRTPDGDGSRHGGDGSTTKETRDCCLSTEVW